MPWHQQRMRAIGFNPRVREDATDMQLTTACMSNVSIHASVRTRRKDGRTVPYGEGVSIHASVRTRLRESLSLLPSEKFQSTRP